MSDLTTILAVGHEALDRLRVHDLQAANDLPCPAASMWDNRPSWDNWLKHQKHP